MVLKLLLITALYLAFVDAHSWMTCPPSFDNRVVQRGGIQGALCETEPTWGGGPPVTNVKAGDRLKVGWTSNNHGGGFARISLVPHGEHLDRDALDNNVMKIACYGHDTRSGKTNGGDCKHPCNGRGGCEYQSNIYDIERYDTTIGIPTNLRDGKYVLQVMMLVGNGGTAYNSCGNLNITGGDPSFNCRSNIPITRYPCFKSAGGAPHTRISLGIKRGDFCYRLDGKVGSVDENIHHVPINVECDPRLSCKNSVDARCKYEPRMEEIKNAAGPFPKLEGCQHWSMLPDLPPTSNDGKINAEEDGLTAEYSSHVDQKNTLWDNGGNIEFKIHIIKEIKSTQCWRLYLQFKHNLHAKPDGGWGDAILVERREENRILVFENKQDKTTSPGKDITFTFPADNVDLGTSWLVSGELDYITALFEVNDDTSKCSGVKID